MTDRFNMVLDIEMLFDRIESRMAKSAASKNMEACMYHDAMLRGVVELLETGADIGLTEHYRDRAMNSFLKAIDLCRR